MPKSVTRKQKQNKTKNKKYIRLSISKKKKKKVYTFVFEEGYTWYLSGSEGSPADLVAIRKSNGSGEL